MKTKGRIVGGLLTLCVAGGALCPAAQASLLALWQFEENTGLVAADASGNGIDALLDGQGWDPAANEGAGAYVNSAAYAPTWVAGKHGTAVDFRPSFDDDIGGGVYPNSRPMLFVETNDVALNVPGSFTLVLWAWFDSVNGDGTGGMRAPEFPTLFAKSGAYIWQAPKAAAPATFYAWDNPGNPGLEESLDAGAAVPLDEWVHVAFVYDQSTTTLKLYINGTETDSKSVPDSGNVGDTDYPATPWDVFIGYYPFEATDAYLRNFSGKLDDVALFDEALSSTVLDAVMGGDFSTWTDTEAVESYTAEINGDICFTVSNPGTAGPGDFTWTFTAEGGSPELLPDESDGQLCLNNLQPEDAGTYTATFDNEAGKVLATYTAVLSVVEEMPATGPAGLAVLSGLAGLSGAVALMRRSRIPARQVFSVRRKHR